jgi:hypothetical protein
MKPYGEVATSLTYPIADIEDAVKAVIAACKWPEAAPPKPPATMTSPKPAAGTTKQ